MFEEVRIIMGPDEAREKVKLGADAKRRKLARDAVIKDIISGIDKRLLLSLIHI